MSSLIVDMNNGINTVVQGTTPLFTDTPQGNHASSCVNCIARSVVFVQGAGVVNDCVVNAIRSASNLVGFGPTASVVMSTVVSPLVTAKILPPVAQEAGNLVQKGVDKLVSKTTEQNPPVVGPSGKPVLALEAPKTVAKTDKDNSQGVINKCTQAATLVLGSGPACSATSQAICATLGLVLAPNAAMVAGMVIAPIAVAKAMPYVASGVASLTDRIVDKASILIKDVADKTLNCVGRTACNAFNKATTLASSVVSGIYSRLFSDAPKADDIEMSEIPNGI